MLEPFAKFDIKLALNPRAVRDEHYPGKLAAISDLAKVREASAVIQSWPGYAPTPFYELKGLARKTGLGGIWYKDESSRFGLGSFKGLGGAYAVYRLLERFIKSRADIAEVSAADMLSGKYRALTQDITVTTATDGNHGRAVAWGARQFGCRCVIYIHAQVSEGRKEAMESYGAEVIRISGNYDDSVRMAQQEAETHGRYVISDTSYPGYMETPKLVMQGYGLMVEEAIAAFPAGKLPTHVFVQGGVGALPGAICAYLWERYGAKRPIFITVEPEQADCLYQSALVGSPRKATGDLNTLMAGLACGEVSLLAWEILNQGADAFMLIPDEAAAQTMRALAAGLEDDPKITAGESAVAGLAAALIASWKPPLFEALRMDKDSIVLIFGTEGATDPEIYRQIVG